MNVRLLVPIVLFAGCATTHDDGFRQRFVERGCASEEECKRVVDAAKQRYQGCDRSGIVCESAQEDFVAVAHRYDDFRSQNERERKLDAERARQEAMRLKAEGEHRQQDEERRAQEGTAAAWHRKRDALDGCKKSGDLAECSKGDREDCERECGEFLAKQREQSFLGAREACGRAFAESSGKTKACDFARGGGRLAAWKAIDRQAECDQACVTLGKRLVTFFATHVKCCDDSRSPSCTYATERQGCCSHHGGACEEEEPK
jgi:hypothetical protein